MKRLLPFDSQGPGFSTGSGSTFSRLSRRLRDKDQPARPKDAGSVVEPVAPAADNKEETTPDNSAGN